MIKLVYQQQSFHDPGATELVSEALFWFAFSLPFNGLFLLLARTFLYCFSLQRPSGPARGYGQGGREPGGTGGGGVRALRAPRDR